MKLKIGMFFGVAYEPAKHTVERVGWSPEWKCPMAWVIDRETREAAGCVLAPTLAEIEEAFQVKFSTQKEQ